MHSLIDGELQVHEERFEPAPAPTKKPKLKVRAAECFLMFYFGDDEEPDQVDLNQELEEENEKRNSVKKEKSPMDEPIGRLQ